MLQEDTLATLDFWVLNGGVWVYRGMLLHMWKLAEEFCWVMLSDISGMCWCDAAWQKTHQTGESAHFTKATSKSNHQLRSPACTPRLSVGLLIGPVRLFLADVHNETNMSDMVWNGRVWMVGKDQAAACQRAASLWDTLFLRLFLVLILTWCCMFYKSVDCVTPVYSTLDQLAVKMQDIRFNRLFHFQQSSLLWLCFCSTKTWLNINIQIINLQWIFMVISCWRSQHDNPTADSIVL